MTDNPYSPPSAALGKPAQRIDVPVSVKKMIRNCWQAGVISIVITLAFTLFALVGGVNPLGLDLWAFGDIFLMSIFTFGVYKNSRTCAVLLLGLFLLNKVAMWLQSGQISGLPMGLVFIWFYARGVVGTFQYHRLLASHEA